MIRLLLVDDHAVVRSGLRLLLQNEPDMQIVAEAASAAEALGQTQRFQPDIILMDIGLPDMSGIEATRRVKRLRPETLIIALTIHEDEEYFFKMLEAGASGYVPKRAAPEELLSAIRTVASGEVYLYPSLAKFLVRDFLSQPRESQAEAQSALTPREEQILSLLAEGQTNEQIASALVISINTVERHRENLMRKLGLHSRADLVRYAIRKGIIAA